MNAVVPILGVLATLVFRLLVESPEPDTTEKRTASPSLIVLALAAAAALVALFAASSDPWKSNLLGLATGLACSSLAVLLARSSSQLPYLGASLGTLGAAGLAFAHPSLHAFVGILVGAGIGAVVLGITHGGFMLAVAAVSALHVLGSKAFPADQAAGLHGLLVGALALAVVARSWAKSIGALVVFAGAAIGLVHFVVPKLFVPAMTAAWMPVAAGVVTAAVVAWFQAANTKNPVLVSVISAALWVGVFTYVFSEAKGTGAAMTLLSAVLLLIVLEVPSALAGLGPISALVLFRVVREVFPDSASMIDFGQNYALIGLLVALCLAQIPHEAARKSAVLRGLGMAGALLLVVATLVMVGPKGAAGLLVGFGIAPLLQSGVQGVALLMSGLAITALPHFANFGDMAREDKTKVMMILGIPAAVLLAACFLAPAKDEVSHE